MNAPPHQADYASIPISNDRDIVEHLRTRHEYCRALLDLSQRQRAFIVERDYSGLMAVIGRKQRVLGRLDALKRQCPTLVDDWKSERTSLPETVRRDCDELLRRTEGILAELIAEETACTEELTRRRDETARQLQETAAGQIAHTAYGTVQPADEHRYLDINR